MSVHPRPSPFNRRAFIKVTGAAAAWGAAAGYASTAKTAASARSAPSAPPPLPDMNNIEFERTLKRMRFEYYAHPPVDGCSREVRTQEQPAVATKKCTPEQVSCYLYFDVDDSFIFTSHDQSVEVTVRFLDDGACSQFRIEYDNCDPTQGAVGGAFRPTQAIPVGKTERWREQRFALEQVRFVNAANTGDFRLSPEGGQLSLTLGAVTMRKIASSAR